MGFTTLLHNLDTIARHLAPKLTRLRLDFFNCNTNSKHVFLDCNILVLGFYQHLEHFQCETIPHEALRGFLMRHRESLRTLKLGRCQTDSDCPLTFLQLSSLTRVHLYPHCLDGILPGNPVSHIEVFPGGAVQAGDYSLDELLCVIASGTTAITNLSLTYDTKEVDFLEKISKVCPSLRYLCICEAQVTVSAHASQRTNLTPSFFRFKMSGRYRTSEAPWHRSTTWVKSLANLHELRSLSAKAYGLSKFFSSQSCLLDEWSVTDHPSLRKVTLHQLKGMGTRKQPVEYRVYSWRLTGPDRTWEMSTRRVSGNAYLTCSRLTLRRNRSDEKSHIFCYKTAIDKE